MPAMTSTFDLHVHTTKGSRDSSLTPEEMVAEARRIGLAGVLVTEHEGWPREDFEQFARHQDLVLIRGLEVYTNLGHVITLGMDGYESGVFEIGELRRVVERIGGYMILAHPFRFLFDPAGIYTRNILFEDPQAVPETAEDAATHPVFDLVHNLEVVNGGNLEEENRFAQSVAGLWQFRGTGGSDAHSTHGLGKGVTVFDGDIRHERDLIEALREGVYAPAEGFNVGRLNHYHTHQHHAADSIQAQDRSSRAQDTWRLGSAG